MLLLTGKPCPPNRINRQRRDAHMAAGRRSLLLGVWRGVEQLPFPAAPGERGRGKSTRVLPPARRAPGVLLGKNPPASAPPPAESAKLPFPKLVPLNNPVPSASNLPPNV